MTGNLDIPSGAVHSEDVEADVIVSYSKDEDEDTAGFVKKYDETHTKANEAVLAAFKVNDAKSWHFHLGSSDKWGLRLNPVTTISSIVIIWGFIAYCIAQPIEAQAGLALAKTWVADLWTWAYILSQIVWSVFLMGIYFSKYGDMKLGQDGDKPEFSTASWFFMLFASGIAVGFFYYGVGETVWHYEPCYGSTFAGPEGNCTGQDTSANRFATAEDNTRAQLALNQTLFHWGIHAWVVYAQVGMLLALLCYRQGLPMSMKSCFYPLIGERIYGWMGDFVDVLSVITTLFGVCTSLGLGVLQLNTGLNLFNSNIKEDTTSQVIIIWCITAVATVSVVSGIHVGIRRLSEITWTGGMFLLLCMFFLGNSFFFLNLYVQSWGWYFWTLIPLSFQTDAFAALDTAPDGNGAGAVWMNDWTIFYWGWWISWAPFVGMFTAKISRGRTVKQFIMGVMTIPIMYSFMWLVVFGGAGLQMEREAARNGVYCSYSADIPLDAPIGFVCLDDNRVADEAARTADSCMPGFSKISRLSCYSAERQYFLLWEQFAAYRFYGIVSLAIIVLYFVTSSDSGSLVIDCLTANGNPHPPLPQRVFWALTEGAAASALLIAGGREAVTAVQTASILAGLPYTFILCLLCPALWIVLRQEGGDFDYNRPVFSCHLVDPITSGTTSARLLAVAKNLVAPFLDLGRAGASQHPVDLTACLVLFQPPLLAEIFYQAIMGSNVSHCEEEAPVVEEVADETPPSIEAEPEPVVEELTKKTMVEVKTPPPDMRFPTTNQARHCYTRYNEYHKCVKEKGEGADECNFYQKAYWSLCPNEWITKWNEERENGTFPGKY